MNPRAVFLDAGNTLFRPFPSVGSVYARVARRHGAKVPSDEVQRRFEAEWARHNRLAGLKHEKDEKRWWSKLVRNVFGDAFRNEKTFAAYFEELHHEFAMPRTWRLYPDALPALKALRRRGFILGIVSNWDSRLFSLCDGLGVTPHVNFILASAVEGTSKPEKEIFRRALRRAGVRPDEALHVGDSFREDYLGASRAGISAKLLCRDGKRRRDAECITSLKELAAAARALT